jgi:hypothetical protein
MRLAHSLLEIERKLWTHDADYYHEALAPMQCRCLCELPDR